MRTLFQKIWDRHVVAKRGSLALLYVDRHLVHDGSFHAFRMLREVGLAVRRPRQTFGTPDHYAPTAGRAAADAPTPEIRQMLETFGHNVATHRLTAFELGDERQGIVHVVGPEQGITLPGVLVRL